MTLPVLRAPWRPQEVCRECFATNRCALDGRSSRGIGPVRSGDMLQWPAPADQRPRHHAREAGDEAGELRRQCGIRGDEFHRDPAAEPQHDGKPRAQVVGALPVQPRHQRGRLRRIARRAGPIPEFTGISDPYEVPENRSWRPTPPILASTKRCGRPCSSWSAKGLRADLKSGCKKSRRSASAFGWGDETIRLSCGGAWPPNQRGPNPLAPGRRARGLGSRYLRR